jgi:hypothetical protein
VVEVETGESVNNLEAMAQWAHYAKLRAPFLLYVPMGSVDVARRLAADNQIPVAEIHSYHQVGELMRFTLVHRTGPVALDLGPENDVTVGPPKSKTAPAKTMAGGKGSSKPAAKKTEKAAGAGKVAAKSVKVAKPAKTLAKVTPKAVARAKAVPKPALRKAASKKAGGKKPAPKKAVGRR